MSNCPPNLYMPRAENLKVMKKERADPEQPGPPTLLTEYKKGEEIFHELWFK